MGFAKWWTSVALSFPALCHQTALPPGDAVGSSVPGGQQSAALRLVRRPGSGSGQRQRLAKRRRRLSDEVVDEVRLYGDIHSYLVYHLDILVGTPGQTQSVIIDTGSSLAAFPCVSCGASCGTHIDPPFDPASSSTFKWVSCSPPDGKTCPRCANGGCAYEVNYLEGSSIKGQLFEDFLQVGHAVRQNSRTPVWLGCHSLETNLFKTQAPSGILGLWGNSWDVLEALASGGPLKRQIVALCFAESGGAMSIGGINETWTTLLKPMIWIAYTGHFNVPVTDISLVGGAAGKSESVLGSVGSFLVDSGTTFTYFTQQQSSALENAVRSACPAGRCGAAVPSAAGNCWDLDEADLDKFPSLRLTIGTGTVDWSARGYLYHKGGEGRRWCFAFFGEPPLTLGASFLKHHLVVFDRDEGLLGFAPAICPEAVSREDDVDFIPLSAGSNGTSSNQTALHQTTSYTTQRPTSTLVSSSLASSSFLTLRTAGFIFLSHLVLKSSAR